ncbi:hypothetical protein GCM10009654_63680 [Streptomyces hebeiensis]|uniref:Na+/H+ antiporter subunit E n=1 Tax=Streptomyces hebeiensis TaxID=229486 RepID=A0ABP4FSB1_9ACTN
MRGTRLRTRGEALVWLVLLLAVNAVFISDITWLELAVGAVGALLGAVCAPLVRGAAGARPGGWARGPRTVRAWPLALLVETGRLALTVVRARGGGGRAGGFRTLRLGPGTGTAWAGVALSATPGAYVVDVVREETDGDRHGDRPDQEERLLRVHRMTGGRSALERALGAEDVR